ncbi:uncharacterized protein SPSK_06502 [Sporothrix schenckii 1099-18]|uniref:Tat pathway signal sequence n=1 Tax=Sporothrix schenckii 1099-18 TaxID=1397361 RepID=A0A0F2MP62_SPOSC|nr:uncharacterized protein SPSK_06502 [Sporothrix schenckii 1099-18]KJR89956.1 hypothetical protein SPSK_06502 [Sporothrix schenckii 1099-18]
MPSDYRPIRHSDDDEADAGEATRFIGSETSSEGGHPRGRLSEKHPSSTSTGAARWKRACIVVAVLGLTNVASLVVGALAGRFSAYAPRRLDAQCAAHTTQYSPVLDDVHIQYAPVRFNGSFLEESVYRRPGAPEVDAAWAALGVDYRAGVIPAAAGPPSGLSPDTHVQRADRYGGGYVVNVEGMHHLHCLNLVRQALWYNYDYYRGLGHHAFRNDDAILAKHVSHCVDILRQVLMCNVDTGVLGQVWYTDAAGAPAAFPDFHTTHTCKNYDAVRQWAEQLQAPPNDALPPDYLQPARPGFILPSTP